MDKQDREDLLIALIRNYVLEKKECVVFNREIAESLSFATGKLIGALTVLELDMEEDDNFIIITTRKNKKQIIKFDLKQFDELN